MAAEMSYNLANPARDVQEFFTDLIVKKPTLLSMIKRGPDFHGGGTTGAPKLEWFERQLSPTSYTIASFDTNGDGTGINMVSTTGLAAYDLLYFVSSTGQRRAEVVQIAVVDSGTDLTVVRQYGSSTATTLVVGDVAYVLKNREEASEGSETSFTALTAAYNYTSIIDRTIKLSKSSLGINVYGKNQTINGAPAELLLDALYQKMLEMQWEMNGWLLHGWKLIRSNTTTARGSAGGLFSFLTGGNVVSTGGTVTMDHINDCLELIYADGNPPGSIDTMVMNSNQARYISAFNSGGTNPVVTIGQETTKVGSYVKQVVGDLPGNISTILVDPMMPKDCILLLNTDLLEINYLAGRTLTDLDNNKTEADDYISRRLLAEFSFTIRNGTTGHGMITGLTV